MKAENVAIRYITGDFKDIGIKEYMVRNLTGNYHVKEFMAVDGVSFELHEGELLGIIGSNGAGKSTLLKAVAGIMEPTRGSITANGEVAALLELGSGFDGDLTVRENAYLRGAMLGYTKEFMDSTYDQIIDFAELREFENQPFKQLSSGMKSRLAFSIASLVKPDILILDEVLSVGDGAFQEKSAKKMREIIAQGATTILVSHSLAQIRELCTKVLWLDHGHQVAFGETQAICDRYEKFLRGECPAQLEDEAAVESTSVEEAVEFAEVETLPTPETETVLEAPPVPLVNQSLGNRQRRRFALLGIVLAVIFVFVCCVQGIVNKSTEQQIVITPLSEQEPIVLRGASIDGAWFDPDNILISDGGWIADTEAHTYMSAGVQPLIIQISRGNNTSLVFNVGPSYGSAEISTGNSTFQLNFKQDTEVESGQLYALPEETGTITESFYNKNAALCLLVLAALAFFIALYYSCSYIKRREESNRNRSVEMLRFAVIMCVCMHHYCGRPVAGYLGVDFFFVLSGLLLMRHYSAEHSSDIPALAAAKYTLGRYKKIIPYYLVAFFVATLLGLCLHIMPSFNDFMTNNLWELFMLEGFGFTEDLVVGPGWYCSALLIAGFFVYFFLSKAEKTYLYMIAPVSLMLIFVMMLQHIGHLNRWLQFDTVISTGTLRGFAELGLGCISYQLYLYLREKLKGKHALVSTLVELFCICYLAHIVFFVGPSTLDFISVFLMACLIVSLFIGNSYLSRLLDNRVSGYLGKISIAIFLNHVPLARINWAGLLPIPWKYSYGLYLITVVVFSMITTWMVESLLRSLRERRKVI